MTTIVSFQNLLITFPCQALYQICHQISMCSKNIYAEKVCFVKHLPENPFHFFQIVCLQKGRVSKQIGHLMKMSVDNTKGDHFLYYTCINKCRETKGCNGITFREATSDCWLKSSNESMPKPKRSFAVLSCLDSYVLYPKYQLQIDLMKGKSVSNCPEGYDDWLPNSPFCYNLIKRSKVNYVTANKICKQFYDNGRLTAIDSKQLNEAYDRRLNCASCGSGNKMWVGWQIGIYYY